MMPDSGTTASMQPITTTSELAAACRRMAGFPFVTVDTEFLRETTYYPLLCVAQMASPEEAVVIDALAPDIDLAPFFELMADEKVMKVFHAARQDIEIVWHRAKLIPHPIFDTQVAAMVLGYGNSISYDQLVQRITGDTLDKSHRFTDWTRRPLSEAQLTYAISDVTHLRDVYQALVDDLGRRGRVDWVQEEMQRPHLRRHLPDGSGKCLAAAENARAQAEGARRPHRGRRLARARGAVSRHPALARAQGRGHRRHRRACADDDSRSCRHLRSLPKGFERSRWGEAIVAAVARGLERDPKTLPRPARLPPSANGMASVELLKVLLRMISERHHVAAKVIATVDDLERIAGDDDADVPALPAGGVNCSAKRRWRSSTASSRSPSRRARSPPSSASERSANRKTQYPFNGRVFATMPTASRRNRAAERRRSRQRAILLRSSRRRPSPTLRR